MPYTITNKTYRKESILIMALSQTMQNALKSYIDLDFLDELSVPRQKKDGNFYSVYTAELQPEYATLAADRSSVILKEISPKQAVVYEKLSTVWNPYTETIFGVISAENQFISVNEFIRKPSSLDYHSRSLAEKRSLSLEDYINEFGCLSETEAVIFLIQLCLGLESIASLSFVHGDVAPQNILLTDRLFALTDPYSHISGLHRQISCKLIDFDITSQFKNENHMVTVIAGTNPYAAPEILDFKNPTDRVDIYSLGCVLSFMIAGKSPKQISAEEFHKKCSKRIRKIIFKCTADYSRRYKKISALRHDLEKLLAATEPSPHYPFSRIPGLRCAMPLKTIFISSLYGFLLLLLAYILCPDPRPILIAPGILLGILLGTDRFHIGRRLPLYEHLCEKFSWLHYAARIFAGIILPMMLMNLLS